MPIHTFRVYMKYKKYNYEAKKYDNWNMRGGMCTVTTALKYVSSQLVHNLAFALSWV